MTENTEDFFEDDDLEPKSEEKTERYHITVDKGQSLERIDKFLDNRLEGVSRNKIQKAADSGCIFVNGKTVKSNYKVHPSDEISIMLPGEHYEFELIPEDIPIDIVYEDDDVIVVNKKAGMVVHPAHGNFSGTLVNALAYHLKGQNNFDPSDIRPGLVHRIDKNTSGLLVIAKNEAAKVNLAKQFFYHTVNRRYQALVWGDFKEDFGTVEGNIGRNPRDRKSMSLFPKESGIGKPAITHYTVLERFGYVSLVECKLETGRTHQIRVHLKSINHPLFNDDVYGGDRLLRGTTFAKYKRFVENCFEKLPRQALHAKTLEFKHPKTGEILSFDSALPSDMQEVVEKWRAYSLAGRTIGESE